MLGASDASFRHLIESFPQLLSLRIETHLKPMVEFLEDIGVPRSRIREVVLLFPPIMFYEIEKDVRPRQQAFEKVHFIYQLTWMHYCGSLLQLHNVVLVVLLQED